jgi:hypothetical protein
MNTLKRGFVALFVFMAVSLAWLGNVPSTIQHDSRAKTIELKKNVGFSVISSAYAQEAPADQPQEVPAEKSFWQKFGEFLSMIASKMGVEGMVATAILFLYDFIRRKVPSKNPASLFRDLKSVIKGVIDFLHAVDLWLDKLVGQSLK